jgi:enterochelin esterase-like enzyme
MPNWDSFDAFLAEAQRTPTDQRQALVDTLLAERTIWPWTEATRATFIFSQLGTRSAALNLDTIKADPPFAPMTLLEGTSLWYVTRDFAADDLLDYLLAIDDPMTPLATETDLLGRVSRHWRVDPRNPIQMNAAQQSVSVLKMPYARPFPDWTRMGNVPRGRVDELNISSTQLGFNNRKLWVYTPPGYDTSGMVYPMLILQDGQWASGPLQIPAMADALIKHGRLQPIIIAMIQSGEQQDRAREFVTNDRHYTFTLTELLPLLQTQYRVDSTNLGIGGVDLGAVAAAHNALRNPAVFAHLIMISPPLGKGAFEEQLRQFGQRFQQARVLPERIFQAVGRYEVRTRFYKPAQDLRDVLQRKAGDAYKYAEIGSGHGLVGFKSIFPEALSWVFPGEAG